VSDLLRISEVAREAGVSSRTLRYYEELGLIEPTGHTPGGERRYSRESVEELRRIRELKELFGFNLEEIREIVSMEKRLEALRAEFRAIDPTGDKPGSSKAREQMVAILTEAQELNTRLSATVERKLSAIEAFRAELTAKARLYRKRLGELAGED
jgi:DNA-binding transcriptional MerR regulator